MTDSLLQPLLLSHVSLEEFGILSFFTIFSELSFSLAVKMEQWVFVFFFIFFFPLEEAKTGKNRVLEGIFLFLLTFCNCLFSCTSLVF